MIIDAYAHGMHGGYVKHLLEAGGAWSQNVIDEEQKRAANRPQMLDVKLRLAQLDRYGIDRQVVTPTDFWKIDRIDDAQRRIAVMKALNDNMAKLVEDGKGRLYGIAIMTLEGFGDENHKELDRSIKDLGLKGIYVQSNINGKPLDLPEFEPFWDQVTELNVPVYIHPHGPIQMNDRSYEAGYDLAHVFGWPFETVLMLSRLVFSGVMERHPGLKVISHHLGGGMVPFFWGRILESYSPEVQRRVLDKPLTKPLFDYFSRFYYDTAVGGSPAAVKCAYEVFGADKMVFATDYPFGPNGGLTRLETYPGVIKSIGLSEEENKKIFESNALKVLSR